MSEAAPDRSAATRLNVTIVSGRRPDLLARTLASFSQRVFRHFELDQVFVNLDPFAGDEDDHADCLNVISRHFPHAMVFQPETPNFGAAVKRLWTALPDGLAFHLEDDWTVREDITPGRVLPLMQGATRAVAPLSAEHKWNGRSVFKTHKVRTKLFGITLWRREAGTFGTSPRFIDGRFARRCGELMNPDLNPERQMYLPHNKPLHDFMAPFANRLLPAEDGGPLIVDIGRDWRRTQGITKIVEGGETRWEKS